jgi:hypothetical protein
VICNSPVDFAQGKLSSLRSWLRQQGDFHEAEGWIKDMKDEAAVLRLPGVRVITAEEVFPMNSPDYYVSVRKSAKTNLFRIYLLTDNGALLRTISGNRTGQVI